MRYFIRQIKKRPVLIFGLLLMVLVIILPQVLHAQDTGFPDPIDPDTPIDGGVSLLLAAGAAYGVKKYREHKKKGGEGVSEK